MELEDAKLPQPVRKKTPCPLTEKKPRDPLAWGSKLCHYIDMKIAKLALEDGRVFTGISFGATGERYGEIVFNTSMSGYQEILTDPSYKGQIVAMTYPLIGNYGVNPEDVESRKIFLEGFVVKECSRIRSNWRSTKMLDEYL